MASWSEVLQELKGLVTQKGVPPGTAFDLVRRRYLAELHKLTGRNVILYASNWAGGNAVEANLVSINAEDVQGFMEVIHGLSGSAGLDLIVHSPGGSAEATEALVLYLRSKFDDIRVFVPHAAMSAATMLACAANRIVLGRHSFLGPIDPQLILQTELGMMALPAHAILEQFAMARDECMKNQAALTAWLPILRQYGPALIVRCRLAQELSKTLVTDWLARYMFAGAADAAEQAAKVAERLCNHGEFKSHGRFLNRDAARKLGLTAIDDLEDSQGLQEAVLSVFHATNHTFNGSSVAKIIENHAGKTFLKNQARPVMLQPGIMRPPPPPQGPTQDII